MESGTDFLATVRRISVRAPLVGAATRAPMKEETEAIAAMLEMEGVG
jgi:hypothetical protein